ncbi:MAG: helix-turn-helix transcriptional regulator [Dongiaceae bacterium]
MRRADRLFSIIQILRRRRLATAQRLARELEVSERTIYRDIADLVASGVPIDGEAGVGYILRDGHDLPPLMFSPAEIEALVLGARIVAKWSDAELARAADDALAKIAAVLPERLRHHLGQIALYAPDDHFREPLPAEFASLRAALRDHRKVAFAYSSADGEATYRTVRPLAFLFYGAVWIMLAWCELRQDFRSFRLDRMTRIGITDARFKPERGRTLPDYLSRSDNTGRLEL